MTRTAFFTEPATANASAGGRSLPVSSTSSSFLSRVMNAAQFLLTPSTAAATADQPYPWLPARIRRNMSPRAQRLIRADY